VAWLRLGRVGCGAAPPAAPAPEGIEIKCSKNARPGRCGAGSLAKTRRYLARLYLASEDAPLLGSLVYGVSCRAVGRGRIEGIHLVGRYRLDNPLLIRAV
jgi:hypothetical protein